MRAAYVSYTIVGLFLVGCCAVLGLYKQPDIKPQPWTQVGDDINRWEKIDSAGTHYVYDWWTEELFVNGKLINEKQLKFTSAWSEIFVEAKTQREDAQSQIAEAELQDRIRAEQEKQ